VRKWTFRFYHIFRETVSWSQTRITWLLMLSSASVSRDPYVVTLACICHSWSRLEYQSVV
jgi:hypothetical protein